ncbi:MAG TPA: GAF domain-containing protein, partial [Mizugakiibacter sp.]
MIGADVSPWDAIEALLVVDTQAAVEAACRAYARSRFPDTELRLISAQPSPSPAGTLLERRGESGRTHLRLALGSGVPLMLEVSFPGESPRLDLLTALAQLARLGGMRLGNLAELARLRESVARLEQAERLQRALYAIADQASGDREMREVMRALHGIVGSLMYAENFYIALRDPVRDTLRFAYYADIADRDPPDSSHEYPLEEMRHSLTWHAIRRGAPLMGSMEQLAAQVDGPLAATGPDCVDWLGVPLLHGQQVMGVVVVQSYTEEARYTEQDRALLTYVAQHIQTALERRQAHDELERRVAERTEALREANRVLQQQVLERQRGERLQAALFRIAELAGTTESIDEFYAAVHRVIGGLLYARNFYIALLS